MNTYGSSPVLWDSIAQAAYISVTTGSGKFISLDNARTMEAKAAYVRSTGIGGMIIWELGGGYRASLPAGQRDELLQAVKKAFFGQPTGVGPTSPAPLEFVLEPNFPNPFNPTTSIHYQLSAIGDVSLKVYDLLGREVAVLVNERKEPGSYTVTFDAASLSSGVYLYRLTAGSFVETRKMILVR
jgi:hypothetical protein